MSFLAPSFLVTICIHLLFGIISVAFLAPFRRKDLSASRSIESPGNSTDNVSDLLRAQYDDPDMDLEPELPPLKQVLSEDVLRKLKPKEKKRQEVINGEFPTTRNKFSYVNSEAMSSC